MTELIIQGEDQFFTTPEGVKICYRGFGHGVPLVLIVGLGLQLHYWPPALINGLVKHGYNVIILDNRDVGLSDRINGKPPTLLQQATGKTQANAYDLNDMANDVIALLDHLKITRAHVVGMSMGGMIAQTIAAYYADRVLSLVSIFSNTGKKGIGQPTLGTRFKLMDPPAKNQQIFIQNYLGFNAHVGSKTYVMDHNTQVEYAKLAWQRGGGDLIKDKARGKRIADGVSRQIGAILKSGDRTVALNKITAPTLVIHAEKDVIVDVSGGHATVQAIAQAKMIIIAGMGHFISDAVSAYLVGLIAGHAEQSKRMV